MTGLIILCLFIVLFFIFNVKITKNKKEYIDLYNKNIELELENSQLRFNPLHGMKKILGFEFEEIKELHNFCRLNNVKLHDLLEQLKKVKKK